MPTNFAQLCSHAGVRPRKPLAESSRHRLLAGIGGKIPTEIAAFYEATNGGRLTTRACRFYPLAEAIGLIGGYDFLIGFRFLPLFVSENNESDPCFVGLDGP